MWNWILISTNFSFIHLIDNERIKLKRFILCSIAGSLLLSVSYVLLLNKPLHIYLIVYAIIYLIILWHYFKCEKPKYLVRFIFYCVLCDAIICGIANILNKKNAFIPFTFALLITLVFLITLKLLSKNESKYKELVIQTSTNDFINCTGFVDSGNFLHDYIGNPVIIIDYYFAGTKIFPNLFNEFKIYHLSGFIDYEKLNKISNLYFYPLPYKTINREFDVMPAFRLNTIYLPSKNEVYKNTIVGISRFEIDRRNRFQVLLNESLKPCREEYSNDYNCK